MSLKANNIQLIKKSQSVRMLQAERESGMLIVLILICVFVLPMSIFDSVRLPIYAVIVVLEALLIVVSRVLRRDSGFDAPLIALSVLFVLYLLVCWVVHGGDAFERIIQAALCLLTVIAISSYEWSANRLILLRRVFVALLFACLIYWIAFSRVTNYFSAFYTHGNGFANICLAALAFFCLSTPAVVKEGRSKFVLFLPCVLAIILMMLANSRSAYLALVVFMLSLGLMWLLRRKGSIRVAALVLFIVAVSGVVLFTIVYPSLVGTELGAKLELFSREFFNKNFFSGRQEVWAMLLQAIEGNELFGLGLGMVPSDVYSTTFSAHNLYLQTILQSGIIGLIFVLAVLLLLLMRISKANNWSACVGVAFVVALIVHECFEVSLTQNNIQYGLMFWVIIAIAVSLSSGIRHAEDRKTT